MLLLVLKAISDIDGSNQKAGKGTGIPGPILSMIKELSSTPLFKNVKVNYKESEISFSKWVSKLFNGIYFKDSEGKPVRFDFRTEMGLATQLLEQSLFVLANEVVVRVFYTVSRLASEIKTNRIASFAELDRLDPKGFLPINNKALTRMCTVSSGTFLAVNSAGRRRLRRAVQLLRGVRRPDGGLRGQRSPHRLSGKYIIESWFTGASADAPVNFFYEE